MKNLKTYEGYYNPPDEEDEPLFEGVLDRVWEMFSNDKIDEEILENYMEMLWSDHYDNILELIYEYEQKLVDDKGDYSWSEEIRNEYTIKKYGRDSYKKQKEANITRLQTEIAKDIYKELKVLYPIDDFEIKYNAKKYNL